LLLQQKLLGANDLILHVDSFKTKVVAVSRSAKNIEDLPMTIYVVTHEEILNNHYVTLADVLKSIPGVRVSQPGNGELGEIFLMRNLSGNYYTKILLDGLPLKPSVVSGMPVGAQLPVRQAERIEIIFGPLASVYGADAASGVVNIITKKATQGTFARADILYGQNEYTNMNYMIGGKAGKNKNLLQYSFYGNKTDFNNINVRYTDRGYYNPLNYFQLKNQKITIGDTIYSALDITELLLEQNGIQSTEFTSENYPLNYSGTLTQPDMTAELSSRSYLIGVNLSFRGVGFTYNNMYRQTHSSIGRSPYFFRYNDPSTFWGERIQRITLGYSTSEEKKLVSRTNLSNLTYQMDNNTSITPTFIPGINKTYLYSASNDILLEQLFTYTPILNLEILGGLTYQLLKNMPTTNYLTEPFPRNTYMPYGKTDFPSDSLLGNFGFYSLTFHNYSIFTQAYWLIKNFRILGGLRYDVNSFYGNNLSPRIAIMYKLNKTSVLISAGTAIKAPPAAVAYESFAYHTQTNPDSIFYQVIPNPNLKPENFTAYEFSLSRRLFRNVDFELSIYYNTVSNLINFNAFVPTPDNLILSVSDSVSTKINDQDAKSILFGGQINLIRNNIIPRIKLNAELNLTYNTDQSKHFSIINEINNVFNLTPRHYGQFRISATPAKNLFIQFDNTWMTQWMRLFTQTDLIKKVDGYYTIDFLVNYNFSRNLQAFVKIYNLLDEKYATPNVDRSDMDLLSVPQPGRNIRFGLTYLLN
jgi:hemoglobin/transferrin/lactoferrin receptor protein